IINEYGADTMRLYIMFVGDFEQAATWSTDAVKGSKRFLDRVWNLAENAKESYEVSPANEAIIHKTIKKVTDDIDNLKMNTAIAAMMTMVNEMSANGVTRGDMKDLILLLNPFAPHITEELWEMLGFAAQTGKMCCQAEWPVYDASKTVASTVNMAVQVNGKLKGTITVPADSEEAAVLEAAKAVDKVAKAVEGMRVVKTILVKNRLVNLIVKPR
ncbi:MAG: class I tRNA ligase family protein, partial [Clostridiales bacterium]|nr:class I tRNA ligase family protein [Clostridiales bacterium]